MNYQDSKQYEIMAPVGSYESLAAAIEAGADSVYFGVGRLNMRSHSANHFDIGDLRQIVAICTEHGIKTYLTVNTIIYDNDLATMREILDAAREAGVSGKCYMSLMAQDRSANRGECVQICRRSYLLTDRETGNAIEADHEYLMSPKDLKTIRFIDKMMKAGVRVFKIEGRARGAEYVLNVVRCYKEAIQSVLDGTYTEEKKDAWDERLAAVFNRGFWDGYYQGRKMGEWNKHYGSMATEQKVLVGKLTNYFSRIGVAEAAVEASTFKVGDKLLITGNTTGAMYVEVKELHGDHGEPITEAEQGTRVAFSVPGKVRPNDKLFRIDQRVVE